MVPAGRMVIGGGSSPLTRGKPRGVRKASWRARLIPAHAGKTWWVHEGRPHAWAHPRSRGENPVTITPVVTAEGSSPLTRGKPLGDHHLHARTRLIPAHAGKTMTAMDARDWSGAHPRSRGENGELAATKHTLTGSSPLTRGKPGGGRELSVTARLIPAHAGKTRRKQRRGERQAAHPRSRGENLRALDAPERAWGSSPLTRGKLPGDLASAHGAGLIPAHAGKTRSSPWSPSPSTAHPRSRGENLRALDAPERAWGSSPLTRGKRV